MTDLMEWDWSPTHRPQEGEWVKVLMHHGDDYQEAIAHWGLDGYWTFAPEQDIYGPVVAWRKLYDDEERP